jgi:hypothetical protein
VARALSFVIVSGGFALGACDPYLPAPRCEEIWNKVNRELATFEAEHDRCERNEDCTLAPPGGCQGGCDVAMAKSGVDERTALDERLRRTECEAWTRGGCPRTTPKAIASCVWKPAVCERGRCVASSPPPLPTVKSP